METKTKLHELSAVEAVAMMSDGTISPTDYADAYISRIERIEPEVFAWEYFDADQLHAQARDVESRIVADRSPRSLFGIPVGVKDIFNTEDMPTGMGSPIWSGFTPGNDARVVFDIRYEDGLVAGKTVTAEFAVSHPGKTINPYNPRHITGTSSSGSAVAVATQMVPVALGTQTAGSTIRPSSYHGIYGYKPTFGLVPRTAILKTLDTLDHVTFMSRCVEDLERMLDVTRVKGLDYPYVYQHIDSVKHALPNKIRVAFIKTHVWNCAQEYAQDAIKKFAERLAKVKNIEVEEVTLPEDFETIHDVHQLVYDKALSYYFKDEYKEHSDKLSDVFKALVERGQKISIDDYKKGCYQQSVFIEEIDSFFTDYDFILSLSTAGEAPLLTDPEEPPDPCLMWTFCHLPAINMPLFLGPSGLPFGAQMVAARYKDYELFAFLKKLLKEGLLTTPNKEIPW